MEGSASLTRHDRRELLKRLVLEDRNPQGAWHLIREGSLSEKEVAHLLDEVYEEARQRNLLEKRQFDIQTMRYLSLEEWIHEYFGRKMAGNPHPPSR